MTIYQDDFYVAIALIGGTSRISRVFLNYASEDRITRLLVVIQCPSHLISGLKPQDGITEAATLRCYQGDYS